MRPRLPSAIALAAVLALAAVHPAAAAAPARVTLAFTGDVMGYLEPCG